MKPTLLFLCTLLCALTLAMPQQAHAQNKRTRALGLVSQAQQAFADERYEAAAEFLLDAYNILPNPNFIWNTARAYEQAGKYNKAEGYYRRFAALNDIPQEDLQAAQNKLARYNARQRLPTLLRTAQDRAEIQTLQQKLATIPKTAPAPPAIIQQQQEPDLMWWTGWTTTTLGILSLCGAANIHLISLNTIDDYHQTAAAGTDRGKYNALRDTLQVRVTTSQLLLGSGLLLTTVGGLLLSWDHLFSDTNPNSPHIKPLDASTLQLHLTPTGAALSGQF